MIFVTQAEYNQYFQWFPGSMYWVGRYWLTTRTLNVFVCGRKNPHANYGTLLLFTAASERQPDGKPRSIIFIEETVCSYLDKVFVDQTKNVLDRHVFGCKSFWHDSYLLLWSNP